MRQLIFNHICSLALRTYKFLLVLKVMEKSALSSTILQKSKLNSLHNVINYCTRTIQEFCYHLNELGEEEGFPIEEVFQFRTGRYYDRKEDLINKVIEAVIINLIVIVGFIDHEVLTRYGFQFFCFTLPQCIAPPPRFLLYSFLPLSVCYLLGFLLLNRVFNYLLQNYSIQFLSSRNRMFSWWGIDYSPQLGTQWGYQTIHSLHL